MPAVVAFNFIWLHLDQEVCSHSCKHGLHNKTCVRDLSPIRSIFNLTYFLWFNLRYLIFINLFISHEYKFKFTISIQTLLIGLMDHLPFHVFDILGDRSTIMSSIKLAADSDSLYGNTLIGGCLNKK